MRPAVAVAGSLTASAASAPVETTFALSVVT